MNIDGPFPTGRRRESAPCYPRMAQRFAALFLAAVGWLWAVGWLGAAGWLGVTVVSATEPCQIRVIDSETGWPVPLVQLETNHHVRRVTDNAGLIAFDLPELMGVETWFHVRGHGYTVATDRFGMTGVRRTPRPGAQLTVEVERRLPGKRLGRLTGGGLFAQQQRLDGGRPAAESGILGCDSVQTAVHQGKLFWGWGDTTLPQYPLGRFHMIGATTPLQPLQSWKPPIQVRYDYVCDPAGIPRNVAELPGEGPTWLSGYLSLPDADGRHRLVASYAKIQPPLQVDETGLCVWNEREERFEKQQMLWQRDAAESSPPARPRGHPVVWTDRHGKRWALFGDPFPALRCPATYEAWSDPSQWQLLEPQTEVRSRDGTRDVTPHRGSIAWNAYRDKWVTIFTEQGGEASYLGEIWYAESDSPNGPWQDAIHVVTHDGYSFYNPLIHPGWTPGGSPILLFEGTYTKTFSRSATATPRYDYNQILYRLDLDQPPFTPRPEEPLP